MTIPKPTYFVLDFQPDGLVLQNAKSMNDTLSYQGSDGEDYELLGRWDISPDGVQLFVTESGEILQETSPGHWQHRHDLHIATRKELGI